jgi:CelD/BcsL family acetyltransferase involved in cellulose biosynthesis
VKPVLQYQLQSLTPEDRAHWDARIEKFESVHLFHRQAWLDYLAESRGVCIRQYAIREAGRAVGYFCGGVLRKGPFRILGSPLKGWGTNHMGPVVNRDFNCTAFLEAIDELAKAERIDVVELANPILASEAMVRLGYSLINQPTYVVELAGLEKAAVLKRIDRKDLSTMRKGRRMGLTVVATDDVSIVDEYYDQWMATMTRKGLFPPYGRQVARILFEHLQPKGMLLALRVLSPTGETVATGLFPHDGQTIYFWAGASRRDVRHYSPNDLMQWTVIEWALENRLSAYDMNGDGMFKKKFGGVFQQQQRWRKFYSARARLALAGYARYHSARMRILASWTRYRSNSNDRLH